jgi:hypothetical protein
MPIAQGREQGSCLYNQQRLNCMMTVSVSLLVGDKVCPAKLPSANGHWLAIGSFFIQSPMGRFS